jgi:HAD superfamily phosphatase (TIGR01668 family)
LLKSLLPNDYVKTVHDIPLEELKQQGIKGIITDLDNTLVEWDRPEATPEVKEWFQQVKDAGMKLTIVSNNSEKRVRSFAAPVQVNFIHSAKKPMTKAFVEACKQMNILVSEAVVVGDQIFTDVLGGNRANIHTILVVPVTDTDGVFTRFNRRMERYVLSWMRKKGMIHWEE